MKNFNKSTLIRANERYLFIFLVFLLIVGCDYSPSAHKKQAKEELSIIGFKEGSNLKVKELQMGLSKAGFNPGSIDGKMGPQTRKAINEFQRANKLKTTGYVDMKTIEKLNNYQEVSGKSTSRIEKQNVFIKDKPREPNSLITQGKNTGIGQVESALK